MSRDSIHHIGTGSGASQLHASFGQKAQALVNRDFFAWATTGLNLDWTEGVPSLQQRPIQQDSPLVTWAVVSSLNNHN